MPHKITITSPEHTNCYHIGASVSTLYARLGYLRVTCQPLNLIVDVISIRDFNSCPQ